MSLRRYTIELERTVVEHQTVTFVTDTADIPRSASALDRIAEGYAEPEGWRRHGSSGVRRLNVKSEVIEEV